MTLEIILGILVIVGTIAGTGLGYALSMRGKREEWAKESRAKRLEPLSDYLVEFMGISLRCQIAEGWNALQEKKLKLQEKKLKQCTDDKERKEILEGLIQANEESIRAHKESSRATKEIIQTKEQMMAFLKSEVWRLCLVAVSLDEKLRELGDTWVKWLGSSATENWGEGLELAIKMIQRTDEVIIKGWETPKIKWWKLPIIKIWKKLMVK
ncbi:MAG: hypothetical protein AMJ37_00615 [Dehalococcoidia bacterium DG_18]|nr:MAG: hypothetical protein AMJ37_00615 [Dehalococcoidia bacterium DG_18]